MPSMHDMIDELNDMDCPSFSASEPVGNNFLTTGCGFGSWIWILLILFYAGQGGTANTGCCCGNTASNNCCCNNSYNVMVLLVVEIMDLIQTAMDLYYSLVGRRNNYVKEEK